MFLDVNYTCIYQNRNNARFWKIINRLHLIFFLLECSIEYYNISEPIVKRNITKSATLVLGEEPAFNRNLQIQRYCHQLPKPIPPNKVTVGSFKEFLCHTVFVNISDHHVYIIPLSGTYAERIIWNQISERNFNFTHDFSYSSYLKFHQINLFCISIFFFNDIQVPMHKL